MADVSNAECRHLGHRSGVDGEAGIVELVVEDVEIPSGVVGHEEGGDDATANGVRDVALEAELGHALDQNVGVVLVALQAFKQDF